MPRSPSIDPQPQLHLLATTTAWVAAVILAPLGLILVFAAWNDGWPFWLGFGLMSPLGLLLVLEHRGDQWHDGSSGGDLGGGDFSGGDFGGGDAGG